MRTKLFVQFICLCALITGALVWHYWPAGENWSAATLATLAALALTAEFLGYLLPRAASSSISFIPYLSTVLLVPNASALATIVAAASIAELSRRRDFLKSAFNVCQLALAYGIALAAYRLVGGQSLFALQHLTVAEVTVAIGLPMTIAYLIVFALNGFLVSCVIALSSNARTLQIWRENHLTNVGLDILAVP
jgi:hypothetical protein